MNDRRAPTQNNYYQQQYQNFYQQIASLRQQQQQYQQQQYQQPQYNQQQQQYQPQYNQQQQQYQQQYQQPQYNQQQNYEQTNDDNEEENTQNGYIQYEDVNIILGKKVGSGLTSNVYEATIQNDPANKKYAIKVLNNDIDDQVKLMYVNPEDVNKCRCLPYIYVNTQQWMLIEYFPYKSINTFDRINPFTVDSALNVTINILQCLKELYNNGLDYLDISEFNAALNKHKNKQTEIRLFDHGAVSYLNNSNNTPFVNSRYRSLAAIMNDKFEFCTSININTSVQYEPWNNDDSICSALFMSLSLISLPPWHTRIFKEGNKLMGTHYSLLDYLSKNRKEIENNKTKNEDHRVYDNSDAKITDRFFKDYMKYRVFKNIIQYLFDSIPEQTTLTWSTIESALYNYFDGYCNKLYQLFAQYNDVVNDAYKKEVCLYSATVCILVIWSTARMKTQPNSRNIDFVIRKLEGARTRPVDYDWTVYRHKDIKKQPINLGNPDIIYANFN